MKRAEEYVKAAEVCLAQKPLDKGHVAIARVYASLAQTAAALEVAGRHPDQRVGA